MELDEARASVAAGRLNDALSAVQRSVRANPADPKPRIFLFQLMCVMGQWDRAMTQLNVLPELDASTLLMVRAGAAAIQCEMLRKEVFNGSKLPLVFGRPAEWIGWLVKANQLAATGQAGPAGELREKAFDEAPAVTGSVNGQPFEWIADGDQRLGPVLEAIIDGRYLWIPLNLVKKIQIEAPADLRDVVWSPAHFLWSNQGTAVGLIPTRYVDSDDPADPIACLARKTDWIERGSVMCGLGQRMFVTDQAEFPILETRIIELNSPDVASDPITAAAGTTEEVSDG